MNDIGLFNRYRSELTRGAAAMYSSKTEIDRDDDYVLYYTPFEHENLDAQLVVVGMTPGPTQLELAYNAAKSLMAEGVCEAETLSRIKPIGAFGGDKMRPNLVKELEHFGIAQRLGLRHANEFWGIGSPRFHATSVVPHAAFHVKRKTKEGAPRLFSGSFQRVLDNEALKRSFEQHFLPQLTRMNRNARYIGLGPTPKGALRQAVENGIIHPSQVLGTFAHPSTSGGSRVKLYLRQVHVDELKPNDPARSSAPEYHTDYEEMTRNVELWRPLLKSAA